MKFVEFELTKISKAYWTLTILYDGAFSKKIEAFKT